MLVKCRSKKVNTRRYEKFTTALGLRVVHMSNIFQSLQRSDTGDFQIELLVSESVFGEWIEQNEGN